MEKEIMLETVLQYLSEKRFASLRALLSDQQSADLAELFDEIDREKLIVLYRILPKELASEVFVEMSPEQAKLLIDSFSDFELRETLNELYTDDTVDLIEEMPFAVGYGQCDQVVLIKHTRHALSVVTRFGKDHVFFHDIADDGIGFRKQKVFGGDKPDQTARRVHNVSGINGFFINRNRADMVERLGNRHRLFQSDVFGGHNASDTVIGVLEKFVDLPPHGRRSHF